MMKERRKEKRIKEESKVTFKLLSDDKLPRGKKIFYTLTKDISSGGIRIQTDTFLPINTLLKIELLLTNPPRSITAFGKVRWVKNLYDDELFEMGLEFVDTTPDSIMALMEHIYKKQKE